VVTGLYDEVVGPTLGALVTPGYRYAEGEEEKKVKAVAELR